MSIVEICNNALLELGEDSLMDLDDGSKAARLCSQRWPSVRDAVLRAHTWGCCMRRAELAARSEGPHWKWDYAYPLPSDCLRVVDVAGASGSVFEQWAVEGADLVCNERAPIYIAYVQGGVDPANWDASLRETLSARMAAVLAYPLTGSTSLQESMWNLYQAKLAEARGINAREHREPTTVASGSWLAAKHGGAV